MLIERHVRRLDVPDPPIGPHRQLHFVGVALLSDDQEDVAPTEIQSVVERLKRFGGGG